jgi:hypothetical protein
MAGGRHIRQQWERTEMLLCMVAFLKEIIPKYLSSLLCVAMFLKLNNGKYRKISSMADDL